jgi:hypothetical protein
MNDFKVASPPIQSWGPANDWTSSPKRTVNALDKFESVGMAVPMSDRKISPIQTPSNHLNYAIDRGSHALHLKVTNADGELVREVIFDRIDPRILDTQKLKGVFVNHQL